MRVISLRDQRAGEVPWESDCVVVRPERSAGSCVKMNASVEKPQSCEVD